MPVEVNYSLYIKLLLYPDIMIITLDYTTMNLQ